jgi:hypothetical protein
MTDLPVLLDTNAAIALLNRSPGATSVAAAFNEILLPVFAVGELEYGARNSGSPARNLPRITERFGHGSVERAGPYLPTTFGSQRWPFNIDFRF